MRKIFCIFAIAILAAIFAGCACGTGDELDFRSMRDVELDVIISLGDSRSDVDEALGAPVYEMPFHDGEVVQTVYENGMMISFWNGYVEAVRSANSFTDGRFEVHGYTIGMTKEQIAQNFNYIPIDWQWDELGFDRELLLPQFEGLYRHENFYDERGNYLGGADADLEASAVSVGVYWAERNIDIWVEGITLELRSFER